MKIEINQSIITLKGRLDRNSESGEERRVLHE
jgi:hypothetical protein